MNKAFKYGTGLIGLYIIVANGPKFARAFNGGATGSVKIIKSLQGR